MSLLGHLRKTWSLIPENHKAGAIKSFALSTINAVIDILSLASLLPLFVLITKRETFHWLWNDNYELTLLLVSVLIISVFIIKSFISVSIARYQHNFTTTLACDLSEKVYSNFFDKSWLEVAKENTTDSWRKISTTPYEFATQVVLGYLTLFSEVLILFTLSVLILFYNATVFGLLLVVFTPVIIGYYLFKKRIVSEVEQSFRNINPLAGIQLQKGIDSFMEVKIYHNENYFKESFIKLKRLTGASLSKLKTATVIPSKVFEVTGVIILTAAFTYHAIAQTPSEELIIFLGVLSATIYRLAPSFNKILINITQIKAYAFSLDELSGSKEIMEASSSDEKIDFSNELELKNIKFQYSDSGFALREIDPVLIKKGTFNLIVGKSGNGKTTLLNILAGLLPLGTSNILVDGKMLTSMNVKAWQSKIGYVPQKITILNDTLLNNILVGSDVNEMHLQKVLQLSCLDSLVQSLPHGLNTKIGEMGSTISGGQAQRIVLARALYRQPSVLLLDEFVNQLDQDNKQAILTNLQQLVKQGLTIIAASHDTTLELFADQFIQLDQGEIKITTLKQPWSHSA